MLNKLNAILTNDSQNLTRGQMANELEEFLEQLPVMLDEMTDEETEEFLAYVLDLQDAVNEFKQRMGF